jgi:hypothetical protein
VLAARVDREMGRNRARQRLPVDQLDLAACFVDPIGLDRADLLASEVRDLVDREEEPLIGRQREERRVVGSDGLQQLELARLRVDLRNVDALGLRLARIAPRGVARIGADIGVVGGLGRPAVADRPPGPPTSRARRTPILDSA